MSKLVQNCTAAERMRGCTFAETFRDSASIALNGGTIIGTPTVKDGINLNGTTDRVTYNLTGTEFKSTEISFVIEFVPDFAADDGVNHYLFDSTSTDRYLCIKGSGNTIGFYLGTTSVINATYASYGSYWYINKRNVLVLSGTSGSTNMYLNGVKIGSTSTTAWTPADPITLYVGSRSSYLDRVFDGRILSLKVFNTLLTAQEALDIYNNTTYEYMNNAIINLPCTHEMHDPTNNKALDICGNQNHATLGNGITSTTFPTKRSRRGYSFDGSTDYMTIPGDDFRFSSSSNDFTVFFVVSNLDNMGTLFDIRDADNDGWRIASVSGITASINTIDFTSSTVPSVGGVYSIGVVFDRDSTGSIYVNGKLDGTPVSIVGQSLSTSSNLYIGRMSYSSISYTYMNLFSCIIFNRVLTPTQIADLHISMLKELNYNG